MTYINSNSTVTGPSTDWGQEERKARINILDLFTTLSE